MLTGVSFYGLTKLALDALGNRPPEPFYGLQKL
jgi:hypothetical protein